MKLYELSSAYHNLIEYLSIPQDDIIIANGLQEQLASITDQFNVKAENIGKLILTKQAEAKAIDEEITRLNNRKRVIENRAEWLKNYLQVEMQVAKTDKIEGQILTLSLQKSPPSCEILDQTLVPQQFIKVIPEQKQVSRIDILKFFKDTGEIPPGTNIITDKKTLRIR
jgi:hypothetical protein